MSIKLMTKVWENGPEDRTETMVLLALADRANDDGSSCYPSLDEITERCRLSRQGALNVIDRLEENGYLTKTSGGGRGNPNRYQLHPEMLKESSSFTESGGQKGKADTEKGKADKAKGSSSLDGNHQGTTNNRQEHARVREDDPPGVTVWTDVTGERPSIGTREQLKKAFSRDGGPRWDRVAFQETLREAQQNVGGDADRIRVGYLMSSYKKRLARSGDGAPAYDSTKDGKELARSCR